jgi:hypothetical protein
MLKVQVYRVSGSFLSKLKTYLLTGKLLHFITFFELILIILVVPLLYEIETTAGPLLTGLRYFSMGWLISLPVFSQLDARSRYQNYKKIKDQIFCYGFKARILKPILKSRCQRDAAIVSARELGYEKECKGFFNSNGYRWYHIIPDFIFTHPQFLLSKYFWMTTFFVPRYKSKVDYSSAEVKHVNTDF